MKKNLEEKLAKTIANNCGNITFDDEITFHAKKVGMKVVNGQKMVIVEWTQDFNKHIDNGGKDAFKGITGFYFNKKNNIRVVNFDRKEMKGVNFYTATSTDKDAMFDIAGCVVDAIASLSGYNTNYDRHNPNTFDVAYI